MEFCKKCKKPVKELIHFLIGGTIFYWCEDCCIKKNEELKVMKEKLFNSKHF